MIWLVLRVPYVLVGVLLLFHVFLQLDALDVNGGSRSLQLLNPSAFVPGNLIVVVVGNGSYFDNSLARSIKLHEYAILPDGRLDLVQFIPLPVILSIPFSLFNSSEYGSLSVTDYYVSLSVFQRVNGAIPYRGYHSFYSLSSINGQLNTFYVHCSVGGNQYGYASTTFDNVTHFYSHERGVYYNHPLNYQNPAACYEYDDSAVDPGVYHSLSLLTPTILYGSSRGIEGKVTWWEWTGTELLTTHIMPHSGLLTSFAVSPTLMYVSSENMGVCCFIRSDSSSSFTLSTSFGTNGCIGRRNAYYLTVRKFSSFSLLYMSTQNGIYGYNITSGSPLNDNSSLVEPDYGYSFLGVGIAPSVNPILPSRSNTRTPTPSRISGTKSNTPSPSTTRTLTRTSTSTPTSTPTVTPSITPTSTISLSAGITPSNTPTPTSTASSSQTGTPTETTSPTSSLSEGASPSVTPSSSNTPSITSTPTLSSSPARNFNDIIVVSSDSGQGAVVGAVVGTLIVVGIGFFVYRAYSHRQNVNRLKRLKSNNPLSYMGGIGASNASSESGGQTVVYQIQTGPRLGVSGSGGGTSSIPVRSLTKV